MVWSYILSFILFLIALGVLITIHELGHFIAAKCFGVYCSDFSIGFGPKICKVKRKNGETKFSIGILPLGGYVSMLGEEGELEEGLDIPKSRSLMGINRIKRVVIMSAGIVMNFVLAYIIFFISASCFAQYKTTYTNALAIYDEEAFNESGKLVFDDETDTLNSQDYIDVNTLYVNVNNEGYYTFNLFGYGIDSDTGEIIDNVISINGNNYVIGFKTDLSSLGVKQYDEFSNFVSIYRAVEYGPNSENGAAYVYAYDSEGNAQITALDYSLYMPAYSYDGDSVTVESIDIDTFLEEIGQDSYGLKVMINAIDETSESTEKSATLYFSDEDNDNEIDDFNFGIYYEKYWNGWSSFKVAGEEWVSSTTLIADAIGGLFVGEGWEDVGGVVAIFTQTTTILQNYTFNYYLETWGIISVNLALFNLIPIPGLDGWQILVTCIEGAVNAIKRRVYLSKVKKSGKDADKKTLWKYSELNQNVLDIEKQYKLKFETTINDDILNGNLPAVIETIDPDKAVDPKYQMYLKYNNAIKVLNEEKEAQNLTEVEPYQEWGIPDKIKNIISYIGLALVFALIIAILVKDIIGLF